MAWSSKHWTGSLRALLDGRGFRQLYACRLSSQAADGVFQASLVSYVIFSPERATSAGALATSLAVVVLPFSVIGPFAGIVLDRVSRQRVLVVSSVVRTVLMVVLVGLILGGRTGADFYATALASVSVNRFVLAALSAGLPMVVDVGRLVTANALSVTSGTVATLLGAGVGSGLRGITGGGDTAVALVAALAALAYATAALIAARPGRVAFGPVETVPWQGAWSQTRSVAVDMADGVRYLWHHGPARRALAALTTSRAAYGLVLVMTVLLYRNHFTGTDGGLAGLAAVVAASGAGTILAAVVTPRVTRRIPKATWIALVLVAGGAVEIALGLPFLSPLYVVAGLLLGFSAQASKICVDTIVQEETEDAYRGRAFSLYDLLFNLAFVAAAAIAALILPEDGRSAPVVVAAGVGYCLAGAIYFRAAMRHPEDRVIRGVGAAHPTVAVPGPSAADSAPPPSSSPPPGGAPSSGSALSPGGTLSAPPGTTVPPATNPTLTT
ncbi:MFS transporter [Parafrankia colletiae]|uniref:MFS transporter n=1 Tax=Parafrankia colletiae TaxID=573497 RepID=A0A1S1QXB6_9ACTN|nr:MFS transporter [Parafrankia colletiae]MCK9903365.1 MFS transporter [Frankia sp. Cpl3]OHV38317.1 MFS transporter [Parafrankia colletiae]